MKISENLNALAKVQTDQLQTDFARTLMRGPKLSRSLNQDQCELFSATLLHGQMSPVILAACCASWRIRGESPTEIAAIAAAFSQEILRQESVPEAAVWLLHPADGYKEPLSDAETELCKDPSSISVGVKSAIYPRFGHTGPIDLDLRQYLPKIIQYAESMQVLGLRTVFHTVLKNLAAGDGIAVKGVTHPPYGESSVEAFAHMNVKAAVAIQSSGGRPFLQAHRRHRLWSYHGAEVQRGVLWEQGGIDEGQIGEANRLLWQGMCQQLPLAQIIKNLTLLEAANG